jgi:hypothetical protein
LVFVPKGQVWLAVDVTDRSSTALLSPEPWKCELRVKPAPWFSLIEFSEPKNPIIKSFALSIVTPEESCGVEFAPVHWEPWPLLPDHAWSKAQLTWVPVGSSAPAQEVTWALAEVTEDELSVIVNDAEARVVEVVPTHSVTCDKQDAGAKSCRAEPWKVTPFAEIPVTVMDCGSTTTHTIITSAAVVVETEETLKELPALHVPPLKALAFASFVGLEPSTTLWLAPVSAVPDEVLRASHFPKQEPTEELP